MRLFLFFLLAFIFNFNLHAQYTASAIETPGSLYGQGSWKKNKAFQVNPKLLYADLKVTSDDDNCLDDERLGYVAFTAGLPGIVNVNIGGYSEFLGGQLSISGIHLLIALLTCSDDDDDDEQEEIDSENNSFFLVAQGNINFRLASSEDYFVAAGCAFGTATYYNDDYFDRGTRTWYVGPSINLAYKKFFLELGWAWGKDFAEDNPETFQFPLCQIGYILAN